MTEQVSKDVQLQCMRPSQVAAALRRFPVVYVPCGPIEWHGRHLPVGTDALKAHGVAVKCAERFGGVVYPPIYFHDGFDQAHLMPILTQLFDRIKHMGCRVIVGISGHNVQGQLDMLEQALQPVVADGTVAGIGIWEISLSRSEHSDTDHAAKWETSDIMFLYPDLVDLSELGDDPINLDMKPPSGIGGLDPREHASVQLGQRCIAFAAEAIGKKAQELLASLPEDQRGFKLDTLAPEQWWMI